MQIICKQSNIMYAFVGIFLGLFLFLIPYSTFFSPLTNLSVSNTIASILYMLLLCILLFCYLPNFRLIFDDSGITVLRNLKFFSYSLYKKEIHILWNDIIKLDLPVTVGQVGLSFFAVENSKFLFVTLSSMVTNVRPALEFAVTKLPPDKITKEARLKLKKKYGIIVE